MQDQIYAPSDFIALLNQTLEFAYPKVIIEGELSNFRISKNRWVYFSLVDEVASVPFFGTIYQLPGPLEDGMLVRVIGAPRMHPRFGFSINTESIVPTGEGALRKAAELLRRKLAAEGLFAPERKRPLPFAPIKIGLITAAGSAAYADFIKIVNEKWGGLHVYLADVYVQGELAPSQIMSAIEHFNQMSDIPDVIVITRGGGSADDLAAFNDERVIRAVASSRIPTLVAIGHEVDISLAELAADLRASTPTNAAQILVPDRNQQLEILKIKAAQLSDRLSQILLNEQDDVANKRQAVIDKLNEIISNEALRLSTIKKLVALYNPETVLKRGYAIVTKGSQHVSSVKMASQGSDLGVQFYDGHILVRVTKLGGNDYGR